MMIHFVLIIGLFLLAVAVMMLARAVTAPRGHSETIEQINAYGFAGTLPGPDSDAGLQVRARFDDVVGAIGRWLAQHFSRLRGNDYRSRLIAAGMYNDA